MNEAGVHWISYPHLSPRTVNGLGIFTAFEFRDYDTEVIFNFRTLDRPGEVFSHDSSLTLQMCLTTPSCCLILGRRPVLKL